MYPAARINGKLEKLKYARLSECRSERPIQSEVVEPSGGRRTLFSSELLVPLSNKGAGQKL